MAAETMAYLPKIDPPQKPKPNKAWVLVVLFIALIAFFIIMAVRTSSLEIQGDLREQPTEIVMFNDGPPSLATIYEIDTSINDCLNCLIMCESKGNPKAYNPHDPVTPSIGILQFKHTTFNHFAKVYGIANPSIWDEKQQIVVAYQMISDGKSFHWSCSRRCPMCN